MKTHRFTTAILLVALLTVALPAAGQADPGARGASLDRIELVQTGLWERLVSWVGHGLDQLFSGYTAAEGASMGTHG